QVASSRLRALETGRWVAQAAPTGFSAFIDPDGNVHQRTAVSERKVIQAEIDLRTGQTLATRSGPWPMLALAAAALVTAWAFRQRGTTPPRRNPG
ncbi:MAG: apolipoprotein N-acyltransferase, partial [bacterium]|nr:apolipoprotein N-acyltransferase [bacterium]